MKKQGAIKKKLHINHQWHSIRHGRKQSRRLRGKPGALICLSRGCKAELDPWGRGLR